MAQRVRKKTSPSPLDFYREWCQRRIAEEEAGNLPRVADDGRKFLGLLKSSEELKGLCAAHPLEQLHPVVAVLYDVHVLSSVLPDPQARQRRKARKQAAYAVAYEPALRRYIELLRHAPEDEVSIDTLTLLENALSVAREDYWDLSGAWRDFRDTLPAGRAVARPKVPPPRVPGRPSGSSNDPFGPSMYVLAMAVKELTGYHDWVLVKNLLTHFCPREFASLTNVKARSRVKAFAQAYADQLPAFCRNQLDRAAHYFDTPIPPKKR